MVERALSGTPAVLADAVPAQDCPSGLRGLLPSAIHLAQFREVTMATQTLLLLPGDGIGVEVMAEVKRLVAFLNRSGLASFETEEDLVGGAAFDAHGRAISEDAMKRAHEAGA